MGQAHNIEESLQEEIDELEREVKRWKGVARWMADCHAANLSIAQLSRTSKHEKGRLKSIMEKCARFIRGEEHPRNYPCRDLDGELSSVLERLDDCIKRLDRTEGE